MSNPDAEERFFDAVAAYQEAENRARGLADIDAKAFETIVIDLEAAIPGLSGVTLGRALTLEASCLHWLYLAELGRQAQKSLLPDFDALPAQLLEKGLALARRGRTILKKHGTPKDVEWADDLVEKLRDLAGP